MQRKFLGSSIGGKVRLDPQASIAYRQVSFSRARIRARIAYSVLVAYIAFPKREKEEKFAVGIRPEKKASQIASSAAGHPSVNVSALARDTVTPIFLLAAPEYMYISLYATNHGEDASRPSVVLPFYSAVYLGVSLGPA